MVKITFCNIVEKVVAFSRQKTLPWKKLRQKSRKNGKRGKNKKIVSKSSTFAIVSVHNTSEHSLLFFSFPHG